MVLTVKKRDGESANTLVYRFGKRVQYSGILREARKRRFYKRAINRNRRRRSALHSAARKEEIKKAKKLGTFWR